MITIDELCRALDGIGVPWSNGDFERGDDISPPYIVLNKSGASSYGANDITWCLTTEYEIELYTERRDYQLERKVTDALDSLGLYFTDGGFWPLPTQGMVEAVITVTVRDY